MLPEYEVEMILSQMSKKGWNSKRILQYLTCFKGYPEEYDEWLIEIQLKNAPEHLELWKNRRELL